MSFRCIVRNYIKRKMSRLTIAKPNQIMEMFFSGGISFVISHHFH